MTGETKSSVSGWTIDTLAAHHAALREGDLRFNEERDRRHKEVADEKEKSDIKAAAMEEKAMALAREIQTYKDTKANELREQLGKERLSYASKDDLQAAVVRIDETLKPVLTYVAGQVGRSGGQAAMWGWIVGGISLGILVFNFLAKH